MENYRPDFQFNRLSDVPFEKIRATGVKAVGLDIDHTVCYDCTFVYVSHAGRWLKELKKSGIPFVFVTNSGFIRAAALSLRFGMPFVAFAKKPGQAAFEKAASKLKVKPSDMMFIGDRIFTDVCGANSVGAVSVYVNPPCRDFLYFKNKSKRKKERKLLNTEGDNNEF